MHIRLALVFVLTCAGCTQPTEPGNPVDAVFTNGAFYTMDAEQPWAEAIAVRGERIALVGSNEQAASMAGAETHIVDLGGRFVLPGLHDAHVHTQMVAEFDANLSVDPDQPWPAIAEAIRQRAAQHPGQTWILGGNLPWLSEQIGDNAELPAHRSVLDALAPNHAVALWDIGGHAMLASSKALELAGISQQTEDPPGGTIERDANGMPTGVLRELATNLILENAPPLAVADYEQRMSLAFERLASFGITSVHEAWVFPRTLEALRGLDTAGRLPVRVSAAIAHPEEFTTPAAKAAARDTLDQVPFEGDRLHARYTKFVLDGSAGGQTMVLVDPYVGTDFHGHWRNNPETVIKEVVGLHGLGVGSMLHAVGDGAVRLALDAIERAIEVHGDNGTRHIIAHTVFVNPEDLARFAKLGVIAEFSPYFWWPTDALSLVEAELGEERLEWGFPVAPLLADGVRGAAGSDWPVVFDPNPFPAIEALVTRAVPGGSNETFAARHAIALNQALELFTRGGAWLMHTEDDSGSLEVGKWADFAVLDRNLFETPTKEIHQTRAEMTVVGGEVVFDGR